MVTMNSAPFDYHQPDSVEEASRLLSKYRGNANLIAGGHSIVPLMKLGIHNPEALIDISKISGLSGVCVGDDGDLNIGALTTYHELESSEEVCKRAPALAEAASDVADIQVRNFGTIGGAIAQADPATDIPAVMLALNVVINTRSQRVGRKIQIDRFFRDFMVTALRKNEVITAISIPSATQGNGSSYVKLPRTAAHYPVVGVAAFINIDGGIVTEAKVAVTGAGPYAIRARRTERILVGKQPAANVIRNASKRAGAEINSAFTEDVHASAEYRSAMTSIIAERAITKAVERAG